MLCIIEDLNRVVCPNFEHAEWEFCRQPMIEAHMGDHLLTLEEAVQRMKDAWTSLLAKTPSCSLKWQATL